MLSSPRSLHATNEHPKRLVSHRITPTFSNTDDTVKQRSIRSVPTAHPGDATTLSASTQNDPEHATHARVRLEYFDDQADSSCLLLARSIEGGKTLELSVAPLQTASATLPFGIGQESDDESLPSPQLFLFPAPLLPGFSLIIDKYSAELHFIGATTTGWIYRLRFPLEGLFYASTLAHDWAQEYKCTAFVGTSTGNSASSYNGQASSSTSSISAHNRKATLFHVVESGLVVVACNDGSLIKLEQGRSDDGDGKFCDSWRETMLKSSGFLSSFSKIFSRSSPNTPQPASPAVDLPASHSNSSPDHVVALAHLVRGDASALGFAVSRDRKLRVWDLVTDSCLLTAHLPSGLLDGAHANLTSSTTLPALGCEGSTKPLLHVYVPNTPHDDSGSYPVYLLAYVPTPLPIGSFFALYGIEFADVAPRSRALIKPDGSATNSLTGGPVAELALLWQQRCDEETRSLQAEARDSLICPASDSSEGLSLWSLWDAGGRTLIKQIQVNLDDSESGSSDERVWTTVAYDEVSSSYSALLGDEVDAMLAFFPGLQGSTSVQRIAAFYLDRIEEAGRFGVSALEWALNAYVSALTASLTAARRPLPPVLEQDAQFAGLFERIALTIASAVQIEVDEQTGATQMEQFHTNVRREWQKFIGLLIEADSHGQWPIAFASFPVAETHEDAQKSWSVPLVVMRDRLATFVAEDASQALCRWTRHDATPRVPYAPEAEDALVHRIMGHTKCSQGEAEAGLSILRAAATLRSAMKPDEIEAVLSETSDSVRKPAESHICDIALMWWTSAPHSLDDAFEKTSLEDPLLASDSQSCSAEKAIWNLTGLLAEISGSEESEPPKSNVAVITTAEWAAFVADGVYDVLRARCELSKSLLLLALWANARILRDDSVDVDASYRLSNSFKHMPYLLARLTSIVHQLHVAKKIFDSPVTTSILSKVATILHADEDGDAVALRLGKLSVGGTRDLSAQRIAGPATTFLQQCLMNRLIQPHYITDAQKDSPTDHQIASAVSSVLSVIGLPEVESSELVSLTLSDIEMPKLSQKHALLALKLLSQGHSAAALYLVQGFPATPSSSYLSGCGYLDHDGFTAAATAFLAGAAGIADLSQAEAADRTDQNLLLKMVPGLKEINYRSRPQQPSTWFTCLGKYYAHVADLFDSMQASAQTSQFAELAIQSSLKGDRLGASASEAQSLRELYFKIFRANLSLHDYTKCYTAIMEMPQESLRRDCLRTLIGTMCEGGQSSLLLDFNFAGLQTDVERNLSFKARNSDPMSHPPYFQVLYSYHIQRADYKSAGAVMYQQAHRLADLYRQGGLNTSTSSGGRGMTSAVDRYVELSVQQARSYLAAMNALALLDAKDAWFADAVSAEPSSENHNDQAELLKPHSVAKTKATTARKLSSYIPSQHWQQGSKEIRIIQQHDLRREYRLVLARLELVQLYPELASASVTLNPADIVALLVRNDQFDKAFAAARGLDVDQSGVFASLAVKCAAAAYLQTHRRKSYHERLRSQDPDDTNHDGRAVLESLAAESEEDFGIDGNALELEEQEEEDVGAAAGGVAASWSFLRSSDRTGGWTGPIADQAWHFLRLNLEIEDAKGVETGWRHRVVVLERLLNLSPGGDALERIDVPPWLIEWFETNQPNLLIRAYMDANLIDRALTAAINWVRKNTSQLSKLVSMGDALAISSLRRGSFIPSSTLDSLMKRAIDPDERPVSATKSAAATRTLADTLKKEVIDHRFGLFETQWRGFRNRDEAKQRKEGQTLHGAMDWS